MNAYQQKWIDVLISADIAGWKIEPKGDDIYVEMPNVTDLKLIKDNLPETLGLIALDNELPRERLKFTFHNNHETFEYILNPAEDDLKKE